MRINIFNHRWINISLMFPSIDKKCYFKFDRKDYLIKTLVQTVRLYISVVSMKLMDFIVQKSVELGVTNFIPHIPSRSQYKNVKTSWIIG